MAKDPSRYQENTHTACQKISHPHPGLIKTSQTGVLYGYSVCSVVLVYSWKLLTFLGGKESAQLRYLHYFIFFLRKQSLIKERNSFRNAHDIVSRCVISRYILAGYRRAQATVQEQMPESLRDISDSMKILALWTTLMSSFLVHCGVCYFTSRGSIWAISTGFSFWGSVWDRCLERATLLKLPVITYVLALFFPTFAHIPPPHIWAMRAVQKTL